MLKESLSAYNESGLSTSYCGVTLHYNESNSISNNFNDSKVSKATGPKFGIMHTVPNESILSVPHKLEYYKEDEDAKTRIVKNYESWKQNKRIFKLLTEPELFATHCFDHMGIQDSQIIINDENRQRGDFETLRAAIAEDILAEEKKDFKIYTFEDSRDSVVLEKGLKNQYFDRTYHNNNWHRKIWHSNNIKQSLLQNICEIAGLNFKITKENHQVLSYQHDYNMDIRTCINKKEIDVWNFEWKREKNHIQELKPISNLGPLPNSQATIKEIINNTGLFRDLVDDACAATLPPSPNAVLDKHIEGLRIFLANSISKEKNFELNMTSSGSISLTVREGYSSNLVYSWIYGRYNIETILKKISGLHGCFFAVDSYEDGSVRFLLYKC